MNHDGKYDNFYGTQAVGGYDPSDPQHPGYPRFPPYDRLDIRTLGAAASKAGYAAPAHSGSPYPQSFNQSQYTDDIANCKPGIPQEGSPASMVGSTAGQSGNGVSQHHGMPGHFGSAAGQLGSVVNGVQPQNIPIYPWMRPMNGGKC